MVQEAGHEETPHREPIVIRAGRLVDVLAGEVLTDQAVCIRADRIESVGPWSEPPDDAQFIDLMASTVLPGLIDCHAHLVGNVESAGVPSIDHTEAEETLLGVRNARDTVLAGFTTVRDVGTFRAFVDVALRDAIDQGIVTGPRMAVAGAFVTVTGGGGEITGLAHDVVVPATMRFGVANSAAEVRDRVRDILARGADFIKVIATGAVLTRGTEPTASEYTEEEIRAAVEEAARHGTYVAAHAHGAAGIKDAVRAGVRSIEHGSLMDDEAIALMAEHGAFLVADIYNGDVIASEGRRLGWPADTLRKNDQTTDAQREGFRKAVAAGVRIAYGTDSGVYPHGWNGRQLAYMVRYGMTTMQAVQSATVEAADLMGWPDRIGAIAPGRFADLIAVEGDAMADPARLTDVSFVMKGGRVLKG